MMLVDANVLIYAVNSDAAWHDNSKEWLDAALVGTEPIGFDWVVMLAFWRIATHPSVFEHPLDVMTAGNIVEAWLNQPASLVVRPSPRHLSVLGGLLATSGSAGNLVNDAHLAALAVEHNATIMTFDPDFSRFEGVQMKRPGT